MIPTDARARKLRTIDKDQLALALAGQIDHVYGYSFILTNLDVSTPTRLARSSTGTGIAPTSKHSTRTPNTVPPSSFTVQGPHGQHRVDVGGAAGLRDQHLDPGTRRPGQRRGRMRRTVARLRRELINIPARIIRTNRAQTLRPPPRPGLLIRVLNRLQTLPTIRTC